MARPNDRLFFAITAGVGALLLLGAILPTFVVGLDAAVGAGNDQRAYNFNRTLRAITYAEPGSLAFPLGGAMLLLTGLVGVARPRSWLIFVVAAAMTVLFIHTVRTTDYVRDGDEVGVYLCEQPKLDNCIGFLAPAVADLRADILRLPIAREREFLAPGRNDFRTGGRLGWMMIGWAIAVFSFVAWFRAAFLVTNQMLPSLLFVVAIGLFVLGYFFVKAVAGLE
jgi:hypothetical protein